MENVLNRIQFVEVKWKRFKTHFHLVGVTLLATSDVEVNQSDSEHGTILCCTEVPRERCYQAASHVLAMASLFQLL